MEVVREMTQACLTHVKQLRLPLQLALPMEVGAALTAAALTKGVGMAEVETAASSTLSVAWISSTDRWVLARARAECC